MEKVDEFKAPRRLAAAVCWLNGIAVAGFAIAATFVLGPWAPILILYVPMVLGPSVVAAGGLLLTRSWSITFLVAATCCVLVCIGNLVVLVSVCVQYLEPWQLKHADALPVYAWCTQMLLAALSVFIGFAAWEERYTQGEDAED
jgi:hypothetical protein